MALGTLDSSTACWTDKLCKRLLEAHEKIEIRLPCSSGGMQGHVSMGIKNEGAVIEPGIIEARE